MDLKQMEYFKMIVDTGSINQAAKLLHMSQPPLSISMKRLEDELGVTLFNRGTHITLTEAGTIFYQRISRILELTDNTRIEIVKAGLNKSFSLGLTPSTIPVVADTLADFSNTNPQVHFQIYDGSTFELQHLLDTNVIDAAFLRTPFASRDYKTIEITKEPMVAAIPKTLLKDNSINKKSITLKALSKYPLSIYRRYQTLLTESFLGEGIESDFFSICDDTRTSLLWAKNGQAAAIFPMSLKVECDDSVVVFPINCKQLETTILFVYKESKNDVASSFISHVKNVFC